MSRCLLVLACLLFAVGAHAAPTIPSEKAVDLVIVIKSERVMYLYRDHALLHQFDIGLGAHPVGDKVQAGDERTPEGAYVLNWRNPASKYYKSIHISYPDRQDRQEAARRGVDPGGMIMIHAQPDYALTKRTGDWTNGCIAVSNHAMDIIWQLVPMGTPIHILP